MSTISAVIVPFLATLFFSSRDIPSTSDRYTGANPMGSTNVMSEVNANTKKVNISVVTTFFRGQKYLRG